MSEINNVSQKLSIHVLCDELLEKIFYRLDVLDRITWEEVCKRWRDLSQRGWVDVQEIDWSTCHSPPSIFMQLKRGGCYVKTLKICHQCSQPLPLDLRQLLKNFVNLETFEYSSCHTHLDEKRWERPIVTNDDLEALSRHTLKIIVMKDFSMPLCLDLSKFTSLHSIDFSYLTIHEGSLHGLRELHTLKQLCLMRNNMPESYYYDISFLTNLEDLTILNQPLNDTHLLAICENCQKIKLLMLMYVTNLTENCFDHIGKLRNLKKFQMHEVPFTAEKINNFYKLEELWGDYWQMSHQEIKLFLENAKNLTKLHIQDMEVIGYDFFNDISNLLQKRKNQCPLELTVLRWERPRIGSITDVSFPLLKINVMIG